MISLEQYLLNERNLTLETRNMSIDKIEEIIQAYDDIERGLKYPFEFLKLIVKKNRRYIFSSAFDLGKMHSEHMSIDTMLDAYEFLFDEENYYLFSKVRLKRFLESEYFNKDLMLSHFEDFCQACEDAFHYNEIGGIEELQTYDHVFLDKNHDPYSFFLRSIDGNIDAVANSYLCFIEEFFKDIDMPTIDSKFFNEERVKK